MKESRLVLKGFLIVSPATLQLLAGDKLSAAFGETSKTKASP
jgi:hypothetical protein